MSTNEETKSEHENVNLEVDEKSDVGSHDNKSLPVDIIPKTHRKATRQYAIRKKKKLTDVFKF